MNEKESSKAKLEFFCGMVVGLFVFVCLFFFFFFLFFFLFFLFFFLFFLLFFLRGGGGGLFSFSPVYSCLL